MLKKTANQEIATFSPARARDVENQDILLPQKRTINWHLKQIAKGGVGLLGLTAIGGLGYFAWKIFSRRGDRISGETTLQAESGRGLSKYKASERGVSSQPTDIVSESAKAGLATAKQKKLIELGAVDFYEPTQLKESVETSLFQASISSIEQTTDGGYIAAGTGNNNFLILRLSNTSDIVWAKTFGDSVGEVAYSIQQTADDGYIVAGKTQNPEFYNRDEVLVLKLDESGNKVWAKSFDENLGVTAKSIQQTADGGYIVVGVNHIKPEYENYPCMLILKLDEFGNKVWVKSFKSTGDVTATSIQQTTDGGYIAAGYTRGDFIILKLDNTGNQVWAKTLACSSFSCAASSVQQTNDGGYIVTGGITGYQDMDFDCFDVIVLKLDSAGKEIWVKTFDHSHCSSGQYANSIQQTIDGGYIAAGSVDISKGKALVFKLDESGNKVWAKSFGSAYEEEIFSIRQIADGGYVAAGVVYKDSSYMYSRDRAFVLRLDANGITARAGCGGQEIPWYSTNAITLTLEDATLFAQEASLIPTSANSSTLNVWDQPDTIIICPSELTLTANTLTIGEGDSVILTTANINVGEQRQSASNLTISIGNIRHGWFERVSAAGTAITLFNLQELQESQIRFVHDGGVIAPSYFIKISHGIETTIPAAATIDFRLSLWLTIGATGAVVATVAGCVGAMVCKHSHKTFRKNFPFADYLQTILKLPRVNSFHSKAGRSYINMIYGVSTEADDWTTGDIKVDGIAIKPDSLLYRLYQAEVYQLPLTLPQERALAEIVAEVTHKIFTDKTAKASGKHTKTTLANVQEQLEAIVDKTRTLVQSETSANSTLLMLSRMPGVNRPESREEQVGLLGVQNLKSSVHQYMRSGMGGGKASEEKQASSSLRLAM
jgi:hypothetical protein